jgi:hypothetical protein
MTPRQEKICELLCKLGRPVILEHFRHDSCVASTKVAIKVLSHFKMNARPLVVHLDIFNAVFEQKMREKGGWPETKEETQGWLDQGAWSIRIDATSELGHVVAIVMDEWLLDLSLDQTSRPYKGIVMEAGFGRMPPTFMQRGMEGQIGGCFVVYRPAPHNQLYRTSRDWTMGSRTTPVAREIIRRIERRL